MSSFLTLYQKHPRSILLYKNDPTINSSRHDCSYESDKVQREYGATLTLLVKIFLHPSNLHQEVKTLHIRLLELGGLQSSLSHKEKCQLL